MNLLDGSVRGGNIHTCGAVFPLPDGCAVAEGQDVILGIRPEHLTVAATGIQGTVAVVEPDGSETHIIVRIEGIELTAISRERASFRPGVAIALAPLATSAPVFDATTGARIP